jgi:hypothetical protein
MPNATTTPAPPPADRAQALRIISALRQGSNCLEGSHLFSAGRQPLFRAAADYFEELEISGGSVVRWLMGRYGQGKTHVFARLIEMAHARDWITSYVQISGRGQGTELHRFEEVYSAIVRNCLCRDLVQEDQGRVEPGSVSGWGWILDRWCAALRRLAGGAEGGDVPFLRLRDVIEQTLTGLRRQWSIEGGFAEALRQYAVARADGDEEWARLLLSWFSGGDPHSQGGEVRSRLRAAGIREPVSRKNAKEVLRSLSAFARYRGHGGILILLDELENVLQQPPAARRSAYTILRELIDNVDDRHGMTRVAFYVSGTPDLFQSARGFAEYEALAERVLLPAASTANPAASVIDLSAFPLTRDDYLAMAAHMVGLHGIARNWRPGQAEVAGLRALLDETTRRNLDLNPRAWVRTVIDSLDRRAQQP